MSSDGEKLIEAAAHRDVTFAADLLAKRANLNYRNEDNETALYKASEKGNLEVVKLLLFHKAKIETKTCDGKTALSVASANGHLEVVMELLKCGASVDNTDRNGMTPLHAVTSTRQLNIALERREPINSEDKDEIRASYLNVAKELMKFGAKINTKDIDGRTPLHWASKNGYLDFVVELLDNGASVFVRDKDGRAPLNEASVMGHSNIVQVLLKHNAPVNNRSWDGSTALFDALWQGYLDIARQLLAHDASVYVEDLHGITCLHVASISSKGNVDIVKELVTRRAKIDAVDKHGNTPLHCATFWGHYKIVKELITPPALVDKTNKIGCTPLHLALKRGHFDILRLLLDAGANVEIKNEDGQTPPELGNNKVKNIFENHASFSGVLSNQSASELIRQTRVNRKRTSSTVLETAYSVLDLSLVVQSQRQNVLTIGLLVKAIVENVEDDRPEKPYDLGQQLEPLWILITRCWRLDPAARPTASEIVDFLQTHSGDQLTSQEDSSPLPCIEDLEQFQLFNVESNEFVVPEETIKSVTSLEELVKLLLANPATSWPLFRNFILYPDEIKSSNHPTFRAANDRQPQKLLVVKLSYERSDLDSIESCLDDETRCHLVLECVDWGEWNVAGYKCYAIIMERDTKNMSLFSPNRQTQPTALSTQSANCFPPCLWKLQGATTYPLPRGKLSHKMSLRLLFCCEVRDNSSCDYFPHDDVIQVEAQSTFIRDALPTLKMSFLLLKAFALISDYNICIGPDYNFDVRDSAPEEILLTALEAIHGQVDTLQRLNKIVQELESGDLNDDQVENYANEIYGIIDDHRERNASEMLNLLQNAGLNLQSDVISGLKKHALISRYVCKKHSELFEDGVLNLRRDPPLHLDTSSVLSLSLAAKYILKTLENMVESTSEIIVTARGIFDLALKCEVHRQSVLVTALMVERIVRKVQTLEGLEHPQTLLSSI
ncbi:hypothetical protein Ae201684_017440 [Aphanomyces euteiches]|uniref:Uncharacterized protein n=1 Tax=Aphanomyces euteiches TaxID=100861 RepID=A0A6G0WBX8_9STRA|nr:hypothetical protein Ae201684_017440 [Aphanomyces euteiches]